MAKEEKKRSKLYDKGPKITAESRKRKGDTEKDAAPKEAAKTAEETAAAPEPHADMGSGGEPKADVMAGTAGIPTEYHEQSRERGEMQQRHREEGQAMHQRHEREHLMRAVGRHAEDHKQMNDRHEAERRSMNTRHERDHREMNDRHEGVPHGGMEEKDKGDAGTEK